MVGTGEMYIPAFALATGAGEVAAGLIATIPMLIGALLQLLSIWGVRRLKSHRRWVVLSAITQSVSFVPFVVVAALGQAPVWLLFAMTALYWGSGLATGGAWTTWITSLVPLERRARFFAFRARCLHATTLVSMLAAGFWLHNTPDPQARLWVFAALFAFACAGRAASAALLWTLPEPEPMPIGHRTVPPGEFLHRLRHGPDGRLIVYMFAFQFAGFILQPFITPYALESLQFSYQQFTLLIAAPFVARAIGLIWLGRMAHSVGPTRVLLIGGLGHAPMALLWVLHDGPVYLVLVQALSGLIFAAYELSSLLLIFERMNSAERTGLITYYNLSNALAVALGSLVGGLLLSIVGESAAGYRTVFLVAVAARLATLPLLLGVVRSTVGFAPTPQKHHE